MLIQGFDTLSSKPFLQLTTTSSRYSNVKTLQFLIGFLTLFCTVSKIIIDAFFILCEKVQK